MPPIHTGLVIQYRKLLTAPARCPKASRVQWYGPPSSGNAAPSSANSSACGTKNTTARTIIQVKAWPPPWATVAMVSTPTIVQMRKKRMSKRPKWRCSFCRSTVAATVVVSRVSVIRSAPGSQQGDKQAHPGRSLTSQDFGRISY